jgi:NAD(P)-dependent dehydrogenase (short-subunit alcohol dehydrogenase family)
MREDPSNNMTDLAGKTALITGSTSGIGKALPSATVAVGVGDALVN